MTAHPWRPRFVSTAVLLLVLVLGLSPSARCKVSWVEVRSPNFTVLSNAGDKEARRIADQFEQFREVFHNSFPSLRVDLGKPLIIFAVKNEDSLKLLLPGFWEVKGHTHPAGIYSPGEERHFVAVRTNIEAENPYEVVYHEYTHAIMDLNFRGLPIWLGEGLAEFFGNSTIRDKEVEIGKVPAHHLQALQQPPLIPIDTLLLADAHSPYYNEQNRVSIFYAESWAIVHYLLLDPQARNRQLLSRFLKSWEAGGDQVHAAQETFGDLKKFSQAMEAYSRQTRFYVGKVQTSIQGDPKSYSASELAPADLEAYRALFYLHTQRPREAKTSVDEALQLDPQSPLAHEANGLLAYSKQDFAAAESAFSQAIELNSSSYFVYYFAAQARMRRGLVEEDQQQIVASLEKAVAMNPQFAPAYSALASVYSLQEETHEKAFQAALKAMKLEPGNLIYAINYAYVLLNAGKTADAKVLCQRIQQAAKTPQDKAGGESLAGAVESRETYDRQTAEVAERAKHTSEEQMTTHSAGASAKIVSIAPSASPAEATSAPPKHAGETEYAVEGTIGSAECNPDGPGRVTLLVNHVGMKFLYASLKDLDVVLSVEGATEEGPPCTAWKGKRVRLYFYAAKNKPYQGELDTIQFF